MYYPDEWMLVVFGEGGKAVRRMDEQREAMKWCERRGEMVAGL